MPEHPAYSRDTILTLERRPGGWRIRRSAGNASVSAVNLAIDERARAEAGRAITHRLDAMRVQMSDEPEAWTQELTMTAFTHAMTAIDAGERFAATARAGPGAVFRMRGEAFELSTEVVEAALLRAGEVVEGVRRRRIVAALMLAGSTAAAAALHLGVALREWRWPHRFPTDHRVIVALHGEMTNRTGHVRAALRDLDPATATVAVVGRTDLSPAAMRALLHTHGWQGPVVLARNLSSAFGAVPRAISLALRGGRAMRAAGYRPDSRELTGILLRMFQGVAAARWYRRQHGNGDVALYGHSGRADTMLLERAQQACGARTVHWLHGLSAGHIFSGGSDLAVFQCARDAEWHRRLGGYRRTISFPIEKRPFRTGVDGGGWLVLTNFTHYGYTFFKSAGPEHEERLIDVIAQAADRNGLPRAMVTWKPHPIFFQSDPATRARISARIADAGFILWPPEDRDLARAAQFESVIATPSGVAVDLLRLGLLPVMAAFHETDPGQVFSAFPLIAGDAEAILASLEIARDAARAKPLFDETWDIVGPGRTPSIVEIAAAALSDPEAI